MSLLADAGLTLKIKAAFLADERIKAGDIHVDIRDGIATLTGRVPYEAVREVAEGVAVRNGAARVVNNLEVKNELFATPSVIIPEDAPRVTASAGAEPVRVPSTEQAVKAALVADPRVNEHLITVRVESGVAYLRGRQDNINAHKAVVETAAHTPGVVGVTDEMETMPSV